MQCLEKPALHRDFGSSSCHCSCQLVAARRQHQTFRPCRHAQSVAHASPFGEPARHGDTTTSAPQAGPRATPASGRQQPASTSGSDDQPELYTLAEVQQAAQARGLCIRLTTLGPFFRITCREGGLPLLALRYVLCITPKGPCSPLVGGVQPCALTRACSCCYTLVASAGHAMSAMQAMRWAMWWRC